MLLEDEGEGIHLTLLRDGTHEQACAEFYQSFITADMAVFEAGANIGFYAFLAASKGARVIAVEPVHENMVLLQAAALLNDYDIRTYEVALSDFVGHAEFSLNPVPNWGKLTTGKVLHNPKWKLRTVPVITVDMLRITPDGIRCDLEGGEVEMFAGAQETLARMGPGSWIFAEFHPKSHNFEDAERDLQPTINNLLEHGFNIERMWLKEEVEPEVEICKKYREESPRVFFRKATYEMVA